MCSRDVAQVEHAAGLFKDAEQAGSMFYSFCPSTNKRLTSSGPLQKLKNLDNLLVRFIGNIRIDNVDDKRNVVAC